jgi:hypothetical protein
MAAFFSSGRLGNLKEGSITSKNSYRAGLIYVSKVLTSLT